jgi:hypothetical protein
MRNLDSSKRLELRILRDLERCAREGGRIEGVPTPKPCGLYELTIYRSKDRIIEQYRLSYERYLHSVVIFYRLAVPEKGDCALREAA